MHIVLVTTVCSATVHYEMKWNRVHIEFAPLRVQATHNTVVRVVFVKMDLNITST